MGRNFNLHTILDSPDRQRVFLEVQRRVPSGGKYTEFDSYEKVLQPIFGQLEKDPLEFPKTVIYMPLAWCGSAHKLAHIYLSCHLHDMVAQFHSPQTPKLKGAIPKQFIAGSVRLVFDTEAFGMGADIKDIKRIIHISCPSTVETYLQEIGRAGRDGQGGHAIMYVNAHDIASRKVTQEMKDFTGTDGCRRASILAHFGVEPMKVDPHQCCDNCLLLCSCSDCEVNEGQVITKQERPKVARKTLEEAKTVLVMYFDTQNGNVTGSLFPEAVTGLSQELAALLVDSVLKSGNDVHDALAEYSHLSESHRQAIIAILNHFCVNYTN